ncbi:MAG: glycoside hydrolase family 3 C-terminal domain-containing protein [Firmicutes bacterium]|nr:glycoside hydrolase family 3 C-terminal domain-containing protein [Bacillota bacterium]
MDNSLQSLIQSMTLKEKASLCSGRNFWFFRGIKRLGLKPYMVADGPHGLRKQSNVNDNLGMNKSNPATCFPTACTLASSWDKEILKGVGERIAKEAKREKVGIVLGPGVNIKRSPLCGRNFEYFSEDPYLSSHLATAFIKGVQEQGVGTSIKHFAVNNQESDRLRVDAVVDERALREIYLASFETAIKEGKPYTVMGAYNKVNGEHACENKKLCEDILRGEWGYDGYVMTDWGGVNDKIKGLEAGIELEMPGGIGESVIEVIEAVKSGRLKEEILDRAVIRMLKIQKLVTENAVDNYEFDKEEHRAFAIKSASESAVLMKNNGTLPLDKTKKIIAIGGLFKDTRYQGSGSSLINPYRLINAKEAFEESGISYEYAEGFSSISDAVNGELIDKSVAIATENPNAELVVFAGLTKFYESEGFDRTHMRLPENQNALIEELSKLNRPITVVLYGGSPVEMPWIDKVSAVLNMYLPGETAGTATYNVLFGEVNPSGKLAESWPIKLEDTPCYKYFPEGSVTVEYRESIFVGYRYYDGAKIKTLFPFGHGLSYTTFEYSDLKVDKSVYESGKTIKVSAKVTNTGSVKGKEAVLMFVRCKSDKVWRADKELKGFSKIELNPSESGVVEFEIDERALSFFNVVTNKYEVEPSDYEIIIAKDSENEVLKTKISAKGTDFTPPYDLSKASEYINFNGTASDNAFAYILGRDLPAKTRDTSLVGWETTAFEARKRLFGRIFAKLIIKGASVVLKDDGSGSFEVQKQSISAMLLANPIRGFYSASGGHLSRSSAQGLIDMLNGKTLRGLCKLLHYFLKNKRISKRLARLEK